MFEIAKQFDFDYGHRVWTQTLDKKYSIDVQCVCKHFHGHRGTILLYLEGEDLNPQGMVWDFKNLNFFKKFIDDVLDHKMILDMHDPSLFHFFPLLKSKKKFSTIDNKTPFDSKYVEERYYLPNKKIISSIKDHHIKEVYEGLVLVNFVPTSEQLSRWLYKMLNQYLNPIKIQVSKIQFFETPKSQSNYTEPLTTSLNDLHGIIC